MEDSKKGGGLWRWMDKKMGVGADELGALFGGILSLKDWGEEVLSPIFKVLTIQLNLFALLVIQIILTQ